MESRKGNEESGFEAVTIRDLFRASLRMRPDRIIVGEIRGGEALDIVQAMVSGHGGCMCTLHASCPDDALMRLETMAMMSDVQLPLPALRRQVGSGIDAIVQLARERGGRRVVTHISEVLEYDPQSGHYLVRDIFERHYPDDEGDSSVLLATGLVPEFGPHLQAAGARLPEAFWKAQRAAAELEAPMTRRKPLEINDDWLSPERET
jgi:pilus assembly protein CpaF